VTLRRIDARFLLPHPVRRAAVLPGIDGWQEELERVGVELGSNGAEPLDLVVGPTERAREAASLHPRAVILEGRGRRWQKHADLEQCAYLPLPGEGEPLVYVPLGERGLARYAFAQWAFTDSRWKQLRNKVVGSLAGQALLPPLRAEVVVGSRPALPFIVRGALELGLPEDVRPLLLAGQGDDYSRAAFLLFEPGASEPSWALKFQRLPVPSPAFELEARGLALAREAGGRVAAHAPHWLGTCETEGLQCTLESAAHGKPLLALLRSSPGRGETKQAVEQVCGWLVEVGRVTLSPPETLHDERRRLTEDVLGPWNRGPELVDELPDLPAVLQHNDVGSWNVFVDGDEFTVLDWEDCVRHGLPLSDLIYFLADVAAQVDGITDPADRGPHFERLFLGEAPSSALVFRWIRTMVDALELPREAVGPIATLCWLHHGLAGERRAKGTSDSKSRDYVAHTVLRDVAERWLRHPGLGPGWERWH
jgi:hypothetical protein